MSSCPLRETTPYSKFAPKPSENTSVYSTEEHELLVYKDEQNVDIIWKVAGFTKRKFSFVAEEDPISSPVLFSDGSRDLVAIVGANRLVLFDETGTDLFWQLEYVFSSSFSSNLLELSWAIILPLTSNNKSILYLLFQKKERKLYFLYGIHQGERVVYCCADLPLLVTYDEVLETLSLVLCNEEKTPCDGDVCFGKQDLDSLFIERIDEMFQVTPKELCFFHDEMGQLYLAIVDHEAYLYFLRVQGAIWSPKKQSNMHVEKLQLEKKLKAFVSIQAVLLTREEFHDLLCLDNMGILHVYVGCLWIFRFQLFWVSEVSISFTVIRDNEELLKREGRLSFRIKSLKDSIASNITLEMEDGRLFRTSLDCFRPHTQPTKDMLTCSFAALTPELGCLLRSLWIFYMFQDWNDPLSTLSHCIEWKSLEQSLEILRRYFVYAHEHSLEWNDVVDLILSKLSNGEVGARNESVQSLSDYSFMSYLTRKYSIFYKTWNIPHPLEENSLQVPMDNRPLIPFHDSIGQILYSLTSVFHLLYESYKTCITNENHLEAVARELKEWASLLGLTEWMEHYDRDLLHPTYYNYQYVVQVPSPCCIFDALSGAIIGSFRDWNCLKKAIQSFSFRGLYHPLQRLDKICTAIEIIFQKDTQTTIAIPSWLQDILPTLPLSLSTLLYDALHMLKLHSNEDNNNWMESHLDCLYYDNFSRWLGMEMETRGWNTSHNVVEIESMYQEDLITDFDASHYTSGMEMNDPCVDMRFAADRRTLEVQHALDSASPLSLDSVDWKDLYENDSPVVSSNKLLGKLQKNLGVCIGRGAFTLSTFISFDPTEPIRIPQICLAAKAPSDSLPLVKLDMSSVSAHYFDWPRFHNGVAASLRFFQREYHNDHDDISPETILSRSWIVSNRPQQPCASHAGVLFGLGLTGHLPVLQTTDWYSYLIGRDELTCVGLILGVACSGRGTMDNSATKMLCIHIRHFNPVSFSQPDWEVPVSVQSAACLGLGLLYQASCHRLMVEGLYAEMTRKMEPDIPLEQRQGFCLAVGFGLGFVCLGMGPKSTALQDLRLEEKLYSCIYGTNRKINVPRSCSDTHPNVILEEYPNRDVITPAALMALCFMYLQTNDWRVATMLTIPETFYDLESIRPDHLYLIVLSRQLILWDYIYATPHYLISLLPNIYKDSLSIREDEISILNTLLGQLSQQFHKEDAMSDIFIGTIMILFAGAVSIGLRYAGTFDLQAYNLVRDLFLGLEKIVPTSISMYLGLLPLSLSLIMAGSGNLELFRILRRLHKSIRHKSDASNSLYANYMMNSMSIGFLFLGGGSCSFQTSPLAIASLLCALYPIFPVSPVDNQYHLQAFRHLYILAAENRLLETRDIRTNKACFVPLEITLKETKDYYSTTCRLMSPCLVPDWNSIEKIEIRGPRYLPQTHWITRECFLQRNTLSHQVRQRRRTKSSSDRSNASIKVEYGRTTIFVRRRMGQLDYSIDPKGTRGLVSRVTAVSLKGQMLTCSWQSLYSFPISIDSARDEIAMDSLMEYPSLAGFFQYFCDPSKPCIYDAILYEILAQDKPETLTLYLEMMHIYHSVEEYSLHSLSMKHFHILSQYFHYRPCLNYYRKGHNDSLNSIMMDHYQEENIPIIEPAFVEMCFRRVKNAFEKIDWSVFESAMVVTQDKYSSPTRNIMKDNPTLWNQKCLWMYLQLMQIPTSKVMRQLYRDLQQTIATTNRRSTRMIQWWLSQQLPINYQHNIPLLSQLLKAMLERNITS